MMPNISGQFRGFFDWCFIIVHMELFVNTDSTEFSGKEDSLNDNVTAINMCCRMIYLRWSLSPTTPFTYPLTWRDQFCMYYYKLHNIMHT